MRSICGGTQAQANYKEEEEVLVEGKANSRAAVLNRPTVLNALTLSMVNVNPPLSPFLLLIRVLLAGRTP